jgi:hypothetical protein
MSENWTFGLFLLFPIFSGTALVLFFRRESRHVIPARLDRLIIGNLLVMTFLAALWFIFGESYYRFVYDSTDAFNQTKVSERWMRRYYVERYEGFRDKIEYTRPIEPGKRRITFLGDSFLAGHGIKDIEDRFPNIIRRAHPEWEIHVRAKLGADTGAELAMMDQLIQRGYQLDRVVLVYNLNDVADIMPEWAETSGRIATAEFERGWLRRNSYFLDVLYHHYILLRDPDVRRYFEYVRDGYDGRTWESQRQRLARFRDLVQSHGGQLFVVIFPFLHAIGPDYAFHHAHDQLNQLWTDLNVPHLDLLPIYKSLPASKLVVNKYDAHPNEFANALAARAVDQFLTVELKTNLPVTMSLPST